MIDFLLAADAGQSLETLLDRQSAVRRGLPFNDRVMAFVGALSRAILADHAFRGFPELMAMAHWFRPVNLRDLRWKFVGNVDPARSAGSAQQVFLARGVVFHIAPSNVDSVFIYSWLLALLCGNANIARVSRRSSPQIQSFFATAAGLLAQEDNCALAEANLVLSYDHDAAITEQLSARCQLRVIWGGDDTIRQIRAIPLPPLSAELAFANRFSLAVISAGAILSLEAEGLTVLAHGFYNDAFWFNQQACSSPRAVVWIGDSDTNRRAREIFWAAVAGQVRRRQPENEPGQVMDRTTTLFRLAHEHPGARAQSPPGAIPSRILLDELRLQDRACHDGNGLFIEIERPGLKDVLGMLHSSDQTIAHFGVDRAEWLALLAELPAHAADRIVPIGQALAFAPVWDGVDLLRSFTREIHLGANAGGQGTS